MPDKIYRLNTPEVQSPVRFNKIAAIKVEFERPYLVNVETNESEPVNGEIQVWLSRTVSEEDGTLKKEPKTSGLYAHLSGSQYQAVKAHLDALEQALYDVLSQDGYVDPGTVTNA